MQLSFFLIFKFHVLDGELGKYENIEENLDPEIAGVFVSAVERLAARLCKSVRTMMLYYRAIDSEYSPCPWNLYF